MEDKAEAIKEMEQALADKEFLDSAWAEYERRCGYDD